MNGRYFISYSRVDAAEFAQQIADELVAGPPSYPGLAGRAGRAAGRGLGHPDQGRDPVLPGRAVRDDRGQRAGLLRLQGGVGLALRCKKPVIPLRVDAGAELPFRLSSREYIDFSGGFGVGLARLRKYLGEVGSPEWVLRDLRDQVREAERELPRADPAQRPRVLQDLRDLRQRAADQERLLADPEAARQRTQERIAAGLEHERQPERPRSPRPGRSS